MDKRQKLPLKHARSDPGDAPVFWYLTDNGQLRTENCICLYPQEEEEKEDTLRAGKRMAAGGVNSKAGSWYSVLSRHVGGSPGDRRGDETGRIRQGSAIAGLGGPKRSRAESGNGTRPNSDLRLVKCDFLPSLVRWVFTKVIYWLDV